LRAGFFAAAVLGEAAFFGAAFFEEADGFFATDARFGAVIFFGFGELFTRA
jgi:hypothetical protein